MCFRPQPPCIAFLLLRTANPLGPATRILHAIPSLHEDGLLLVVGDARRVGSNERRVHQRRLTLPAWHCVGFGALHPQRSTGKWRTCSRSCTTRTPRYESTSLTRTTTPRCRRRAALAMSVVAYSCNPYGESLLQLQANTCSVVGRSRPAAVIAR